MRAISLPSGYTYHSTVYGVGGYMSSPPLLRRARLLERDVRARRPDLRACMDHHPSDVTAYY
jgi:hypothetical protein